MNKKIFNVVLLFLCFTLTSCEIMNEVIPSLLYAGVDYGINKYCDDESKTLWNNSKNNNIQAGSVPTRFLDASTRFQDGDNKGAAISAAVDMTSSIIAHVNNKREQKRIEEEYPEVRKERIHCLIYTMGYCEEDATLIIDQWFPVEYLTDREIMKLSCWDFCRENGIERGRCYTFNFDNEPTENNQNTENVVSDVQISETNIDQNEAIPVNENTTIVADKTSNREIAAEEIDKTIVCNFECDGVTLSEAQKNQLDGIAECLLQYPDLNLCIIGHTCNIGTELANDHVGLRRAQNAKDYLMNKGIAESRITVDNKGANEPIVDNNSENNRKQNRRIEFRIIK